MKEVKVKTIDLLNKVKENRSKHVAEYAEAVEGYKQQAMERLDSVVKKLKRDITELKAGEVLRLNVIHFDLVVPENHVKDYDQVITMLQMSVDAEIILRYDEFSRYVMDCWEWRDTFENTKMLYSNTKK